MPSPYLPGRSNADFEKLRERALEDNRKEAERQAADAERLAEYKRQYAAHEAALQAARAEEAEKAEKMRKAFPKKTVTQAWFDGDPLPGLPDLAKRVYIMPGTLICNSGGLLSGGAARTALLIGECSVIKTKMEVKVFPPTEGEAYMEGAYHNIVLVGRRSDKISDGRLFTGWVKIDRLTN